MSFLHLKVWKIINFGLQQIKKIFKKIGVLINDIAKSHFSGLGKPEALKYEILGYWTRQIDGKID